MNRFRKWRKRISVGFLSVFVLCLGMILTTGVVQADDIEDESLYARSNYIMQYFNEKTAPTEDEDSTPEGVTMAADMNVGTAGAFLGYCDEAEEGIRGWLSSRLSMSSMSYTYNQFKDTPVGGNNTKRSVYYYARYGYTLGQLGLDYTSSKNSFAFGRIVGGSLLMLAYVMALAVPALFNCIFTILKWLNPFRLFVGDGSFKLMSAEQYAAATASGTAGVSAGTSTWQNFSNVKSAPSALASLASVVQSWYNSFSQFSWYVIIPIFVVSLLVSVGLLHQSTAWSKGKKLILRIVFLAIGVPICGSLYTMTLDKCDKMTSVGNSAATKVVSSVLVDFESWAVNMRLCPTSGMVIESETASNTAAGQPTAAALSNLRKTCQEINSVSGSIPGLPRVTLKNVDISSLYDGSDLEAGSSVMDTNDKKELTNWDNTIMSAQKGTGDNLGSVKTVTATMSLIARYVNNSALEPGAYESLIKSELQNEAFKNADNNKNIWDMLGTIDSDVDLGDVSPDVFNSNKTMFGGYNIYGNGKFVVTSSSGGDADAATGTVSDSLAGGGSSDTDTGMDSLRYLPAEGTTPKIMSGKDHLTTVEGLSVMSMYNYLCSSFNSSNIVTYSPADSSSEFVKESHRSVNLIGSGLSQFLYLINALTLLLCLTVIGVYYALAIVLANIFRGVRMIMSVPMALLGSLSAIAKFLTYTVMMIVEIIGTIFLYSLIAELLFSLTDVVEAPFVNAIASVGVFKSVAGMLLTVSILLSTILYIVFTAKAMKVRKSFVKAIDEALERIIEKFVGAAAAMPNKGGQGMMGKIGSGVASGAGMALGNRAMSSAMNRGNGADATKGQKTSSNGEDSSGSNELAETGSSDVSNPQDNVNMDSDDNSENDTNVNAEGAELNSDGADATKDSSEGKAIMEQNSLSRAGDDGDTDAESDAAIKSATGEVSATQEDEIKQQEAEDAANQRKEAAKDAEEGAKDTAKGTAKVAVGAETGDAKMAADGAKDLKDGTEKTQGAADKAAHADEDAKARSSEKMNQAAAQNQQSGSHANTERRQQASADVSDNKPQSKDAISGTDANRGGSHSSAQGSDSGTTKRTMASKQSGPASANRPSGGSSGHRAANASGNSGSPTRSARGSASSGGSSGNRSASAGSSSGGGTRTAQRSVGSNRSTNTGTQTTVAPVNPSKPKMLEPTGNTAPSNRAESSGAEEMTKGAEDFI